NRDADGLHANASCEVLEEATFIIRKWIANKVGRNDRFVTDNWRTDCDNVHTTFFSGGPGKR
ncbi:hypothetical protein SK128_009016, partial [Halocaridina rubra]